MICVANYQYGWTFFVDPIVDKLHASRKDVQYAFTLFVILETWLVPVEGWLVDRFGPRWIVVIGGALCAIAWSINSVAESLPVLYFAAAVAGIGAGGVYGTCIGNAVRWFPGRRGLAAGLTAAGFGAGSALTVVPIQNMIKASGYEQTFLSFGLGQGLIVVALGFLILVPPARLLAAPIKVAPGASTRQSTPLQMVQTPVFWLMYAMFIMMAMGGLMAVAQLAPIAKDFKIAEVPVSLLGLTLPALSFAASLDRVLNGLCRPFFGWVSDHIGRENTMCLAFAIEGFGIIALANLGQDPVMFVILSGVVFFAWGEIYSLFPATTADTFGTTYATTNTGLMYTAKGWAAIFVPIASGMVAKSNGWHGVFVVCAIANFLAAALALLALKPLRAKYATSAPPPTPQPARAAA
jgi:OFA family oxalate/formate antiporter-like MFS transporter